MPYNRYKLIREDWSLLVSPVTCLWWLISWGQVLGKTSLVFTLTEILIKLKQAANVKWHQLIFLCPKHLLLTYWHPFNDLHLGVIPLAKQERHFKSFESLIKKNNKKTKYLFDTCRFTHTHEKRKKNHPKFSHDQRWKVYSPVQCIDKLQHSFNTTTCIYTIQTDNLPLQGQNQVKVYSVSPQTLIHLLCCNCKIIFQNLITYGTHHRN